MSHFTVIVAVPGDVAAFELDDKVGEILAPYDENTTVERYVEYTRAQAIEKEQAEIREYATSGYYAKYLEDPAAYIASTNNRGHLRYLGVAVDDLPAPVPDSFGFMSQPYRNEEEYVRSEEEQYLMDLTFPDKLALVGDETLMHKLATRWHEDDGSVDEDGNIWSTYNPKSQWDWWTVGGRWAGYFNATELGQKYDDFYNEYYTEYAKDGLDRVRVDELRGETRAPFGFVDLNGEWNQKGKMGWFGMSSDEMTQEEWEKGFADWIASLPKDTWLVLTDCHI